MKAPAPGRLKARIESLQREMRELAEACDWDGVGRRLRQRNTMLQGLGPETRKACLGAALESDRQILAVATAERGATVARLTRLRQHRAGASEYRGTRARR